ncbi:MAG: hypothetical protein ABIG61_13020 [Planctomycetota bacterium]
MNEELKKLPHIVKFNEVKYDLHDPWQRFKRSEFHYFLKDKEQGLVAGYWEAQDGYEDLGKEQDSFHELLLVIEGSLYVRSQNCSQELVAGPGDTVVVVRGRNIRIIVREPVKVFFVCYPMGTGNAIDDYEKMAKK